MTAMPARNTRGNAVAPARSIPIVRTACNGARMASARPYAPLPGNAHAIIASLGNQQPWTYAPTPAAIEGARAHAKTWATAHPSHAVAVVLATDGQPNLCGNAQDRIGSVAQSAAAGLGGSPS